MRIILFFCLFSNPALAADHFLYKFRGYQRVGDVLHKYEIGPLWGPAGHVQKTIDMNPDLMDKNGQLYNTGVWVKLPIPAAKNWKLPEEINGRLKHVGHEAVMDKAGFEERISEKELKRRKLPEKKQVYMDVGDFKKLNSLNWGQDPFRKPAGIKTLSEEEAAMLGTLKLEYIEFDPEFPSAVIDGKTVYEGSVTKDGAVLKIGYDYVLLKKGTQVKQLVMAEEKIQMEDEKE